MAELRGDHFREQPLTNEREMLSRNGAHMYNKAASASSPVFLGRMREFFL